MGVELALCRMEGHRMSWWRILHTVTCATCYAATILHVLVPCAWFKDTGCPGGGYSTHSLVPRVMELQSFTCWSLAKDLRTQDVLPEDTAHSHMCHVLCASTILHVLVPCKGFKDTGGPGGGYSTHSIVPRVMQLRSCTCWSLAKDLRTQDVLAEDTPHSHLCHVLCSYDPARAGPLHRV